MDLAKYRPKNADQLGKSTVLSPGSHAFNLISSEQDIRYCRYAPAEFGSHMRWSVKVRHWSGADVGLHTSNTSGKMPQNSPMPF